MKNIVLSIVNKVNYKKMMHFPSKIPYMVLFISYKVIVDYILVKSMKNNLITILGYKRANISNLTTFSLYLNETNCMY